MNVMLALTGRSLNIYSWKDHKLLQTIPLGEDGIAPLEIRFLHDPVAAQGFVGCAVMANVFRYKFVVNHLLFYLFIFT